MTTTTIEKFRVSPRMTESAHQLLSEAAAIVGTPVSQFVLQSALEKASRIIASEKVVRLSSQASKQILDAIENPPKANEKLRAALRLHKDMV